MTTGTYHYQNAERRTTYFRGYVQWYDGARRIRVSAPAVRATRGEAERDAKNMKKLATRDGIPAMVEMRRRALEIENQNI